MTVSIRQVDRGEIRQLIFSSSDANLSDEDWGKMDMCLALTSQLYVGAIDGKFICAWGLILPTILSTQAYLWLYTSEAIKGNEFFFVRHSQKALQAMLEEFPEIVGHTNPKAESSIRWLRWLGAEFLEEDNNRLSFRITNESSSVRRIRHR